MQPLITLAVGMIGSGGLLGASQLPLMRLHRGSRSHITSVRTMFYQHDCYGVLPSRRRMSLLKLHMGHRRRFMHQH